MSTTTPNLGLKYLVQGQLQKEVTVNDDLNILDAVIGSAGAFGYNPSSSSNLTYAYFGGPILFGGVPKVVASGSLTLPGSTTSYIQRSPDGSQVSNSTGWVEGMIPMALVVTNAGGITQVTDYRPVYSTAQGNISISIGCPTGVAVTTATTGGSLEASTANEYQVTAVYPWGESAPCPVVSVTTGSTATNANTITWTLPAGALSVNVYGRVAGSIAKIANVAAGTSTYTDTGSVTPSGAAPTTMAYTFTSAEMNGRIVTLDGELTANAVITCPALPAYWILVNDTTGAFVVNLTTSGATNSGASPKQGAATILYADGTNINGTAASGGGGGSSGAVIIQIGTGVTLTPSQAANAIIRVQGTLTADAVVTFPANIQQVWELSNETTGNYTLTAEVAGGTAIPAIAQGTSQVVWSSGNNLHVTTGAQGVQGPSGTIAVGTVTTGAPGSSAAVTNSGTNTAAVFDFKIPQGNTGNTGPSGTLTVGTVTTGAPGSSATVTNSGTNTAAVLDFQIPQGQTGNIGTPGSTVQQPLLVGETEQQVTNATSGTAATLNQANGTVQLLTLTGNCALTLSPTAGGSASTASMTIILTQDATGSRTVTWPTGTIFTAGSAPTLSTTAGQSDIFVAFLLAGSSNWVVAVIAQGVTL